MLAVGAGRGVGLRAFLSAGVPIHFIDAGAGEPVVLVHGFMSDLRSAWVRRGIFGALAERFRTVALDCRGHGRSGKPHDPAAYGPEIALDVLRLMDHLGIERAHLVGYSMGAHAAAQLLARQPDRLLTATLGGACGRIGWSEEDERLAEVESAELEAGTLRSQLIRLTPAGAPMPTPRKIRTRSRSALKGQDLTALAAIRRANRYEAVSEAEMAAVSTPVLGLVGSHDPYLADFRRLVRIVPSLRVVVVEGGTHRTTPGTPAFLLVLQRFLAAHAASASR